MAVSINRVVKNKVSMSRPPVDKVDFGKALVFSDEYYFDDGTITAEVSKAEQLIELNIKDVNGQTLKSTDTLYKSVRQLTSKDELRFVLGLRHKDDSATNSTEIYFIQTTGADFDGINFSCEVSINSDTAQVIDATGVSGDNNLKILEQFLDKIKTADTENKLVAEIKSDKLFISPADISDTLTVISKLNTEVVQASERSTRTDISTMLNRILKEKAAYIVLSPTRDIQKVKDIAETLKGKKLGYFTASDDKEIINRPASSANDIMHFFSSKNTPRIGVMYSSKSDEYPEFCWVAERIGYPPSSVKWAYSPCGDIVPDDLNETQLQNIIDKKGNCYLSIAGRDLIMGGGVFADGTFIDLQIGMDWQEEEVTKTIFSELTKKEKRDFDDQGITYMGEILRGALEKGKKYFSHSYEIILPKESDFTPDERATRNLKGIRWLVRAKSGFQTAELHGELGT